MVLRLRLVYFIISLTATYANSRLQFCGIDDNVYPNMTYWTNYGSQVIVPEMKLNFSGYITGWSALTLILTLPNYVEILTHAITFQVWRPSNPTAPQGYTLVGSNRLEFEQEALLQGITNISGLNNMSYFNFTDKQVPMEERIHFKSGDIVGWYVLPLEGITIPLSVLYSPDESQSTCIMYQYSYNEEQCTICSTQQAAVVSGAMPHVALSFVEEKRRQVCSKPITECAVPQFVTTSPPVMGTPTNSQTLNNTSHSSDCHLATILGIFVLVAVGTLFIVQVTLCVICIITLARMRQQNQVDSPIPLRLISESDSESKSRDLIVQTDNPTYMPATSISPATYEEVLKL